MKIFVHWASSARLQGWASILVMASTSCGGASEDPGSDGPHGEASANEDLPESGLEIGDAGAAPSGDGAVEGDAQTAGDGQLSDGGASMCLVKTTVSALAHVAKSAGFSGTDTAYFALYDAACQTKGDCTAPCMTAGGTEVSCSTGSDCVATGQSGATTCLPPTYWLYADGALSESSTTANDATLTLVAIDYRDSLVASDFRISIPGDAVVRGIRFDVRRNSDSASAVDDAIQITKDGAPVGLDHEQATPWPTSLTTISYGSAEDSWGVAWQSADIRANGFGISITPKYTGDPAGNDRAHIDSVRATVYFTEGCN